MVIPAVSTPPTSRQQRADETRARIFAAATELFARDGYHATSIDRIASAAGVAKGTFFVHFPSKDAVIAELVRIQTSAARKARERALAAGGTPVDAMRAAVMTLGAHAAASRTLSRGVLASTLESPEIGGVATALFDELYAQMIEDARAAARARLLRPHVDPEAFASTLMASYLGAVLHFASSPSAKPLTDLLGPLVDTNLAGALRPPRAAKRRARRR
jgi:AcrR family transcriptional regulator